MGHALTHEEFVDKLYTKHNYPKKDLKFTVKYVDNRVPVVIENKYGEFRIMPRTLKEGGGVDAILSFRYALDKNAYIRNIIKQNNPIIFKDIEIISDLDKVTKMTQVIHFRYKGIDCKARLSTLFTTNKITASMAVNITDYFVSISKEHWGDRYIYNDTKYNKKTQMGNVTCSICGEEFNVGLYSHVSRNQGCPECAREKQGGWTRSHWSNVAGGRDCTLYILKFKGNNEVFYKIGRTVNEIWRRFGHGDLPKEYTYEKIKIIKGTAEVIYDLELKFHSINKVNHYTPKIPFKGSVKECYIKVEEELLKW